MLARVSMLDQDRLLGMHGPKASESLKAQEKAPLSNRL